MILSIYVILGIYCIVECSANQPPIFTKDLNNVILSELLPVGSIIGRLNGYDPEGGPVSFGILGTDYFEVNSTSGDVQLVKQLDREVSFNKNCLMEIHKAS